MRLLTYLIAAALLWALATTGPVTQSSSVEPAAAAPAAAPGARAVSYPR